MVVAVLVKKHFYPHSLGGIMLKYKKSILILDAFFYTFNNMCLLKLNSYQNAKTYRHKKGETI
jgi:hypothetical protein